MSTVSPIHTSRGMPSPRSHDHLSLPNRDTPPLRGTPSVGGWPVSHWCLSGVCRPAIWISYARVTLSVYGVSRAVWGLYGGLARRTPHAHHSPSVRCLVCVLSHVCPWCRLVSRSPVSGSCLGGFSSLFDTYTSFTVIVCVN